MMATTMLVGYIFLSTMVNGESIDHHVFPDDLPDLSNKPEPWGHFTGISCLPFVLMLLLY
jgi:hypothetical protein